MKLFYNRMNSRKRVFGAKRIGTNKTVSNVRCIKAVSDAKLAKLKTRFLKKRTFNKMQWGVRAFREWHNERLSSDETFDKVICSLDIDVLSLITKANLCHALCKFILEITKKKDGSDYLGKTLYELVVSIQKYLNQNDIPWKIIDDPEFLDVKTVLDNTMKDRAIRNIGMVKRQAEFISLDYEEELWKSGTLGEDTPDKLRDTVLFILGINLALRAGDEHHDLRRNSPDKSSQLSFERDQESGKRCLVHREDTVMKTNDGGLSNLKKDRKIVWIFPSKNIVRCPVRLVDKYVSLCPEVTMKSKKNNFYLRSLEKPNPAQWYGEQAVRKNTLSKVVSELLKSANLDGYFTNHSLRRTSATRLFQAGVDKKIVCEITGHVSDAINKYQVTSNQQKENVSKILNPTKIDAEYIESKPTFKPPVPTLELSISDNNEKGGGTYKCCCKRKEFNICDGNQLGEMINDLVSKRRSGKAKIKLEIEFSD